MSSAVDLRSSSQPPTIVIKREGQSKRIALPFAHVVVPCPDVQIRQQGGRTSFEILCTENYFDIALSATLERPL